LGWVSALNLEGRTFGFWARIATEKRFIVRADEKLTAFVELEAAVALAANCLDGLASFFQTRRR
jgi:hypothetical protein